MHHDGFPVIWIILLVILLLPLWFAALLGLISLILSSNGWRRLAGQFAARSGMIGNTFYRVVGMVGGATYKGAMKVTVTATGMLLEASPVLFIGHKPLFIPFGAMRDPQPKRMFHGDYLAVAVGTPEIARLSLPAAVFKVHRSIRQPEPELAPPPPMVQCKISTSRRLTHSTWTPMTRPQ